MSNDCKECRYFGQRNGKRKSLNQMTDEERVKYLEALRKLGEDTDKTTQNGARLNDDVEGV